MELRQLHAFLEIVRTGALTRAAVSLAVAQPVLSRQIKALEQELGATLFHRTGRGLVCTAEGKLLERYAATIVAAASSAESEIHALHRAPTERVMLGIPPSLGAVLTTPLVQQFRREVPTSLLGVMEGFSGHVLDWLMTGQLDVAVLYDAPRIRALATDPLVTDEIFLLGPASDPAGVGPGPVKAIRLAQIPMILPSRPHGLRVQLDQVLAKAGSAPNARLEINAMPSTLKLVEAGAGYTILSYSCVHQEVVSGRIRCWRIVQPTMTRSLVVATSTRQPVGKVSRMLVRIVREQIHGLVAEGFWAPSGI